MTKTPMPVITGILIIVSGILNLIGFTIFLIASVVISVATMELNGYAFGLEIASGLLFFITGFLLVVGTLSLLGGIYALQRKKWGWVLAGSICAIIPKFPLGLVAIIITSMSKNEFE